MIYQKKKFVSAVTNGIFTIYFPSDLSLFNWSLKNETWWKIDEKNFHRHTWAFEDDDAAVASSSSSITVVKEKKREEIKLSLFVIIFYLILRMV